MPLSTRLQLAKAADASTPAIEPISTDVLELDGTIKQMLAKNDIDEDDLASVLLKTLQSSTSACIQGLPLETKTKILLAFGLRPPTQPPTLSKRFKEIKDFDLTSFDSKSLEELKTTVPVLQLTIYHLDKMGYLPSNAKNNKKADLATLIYGARDHEFFKNLTCAEIKTKVGENAPGHYYHNSRHNKRCTLVHNLRDAQVSV